MKRISPSIEKKLKDFSFNHFSEYTLWIRYDTSPEIDLKFSSAFSRRVFSSCFDKEIVIFAMDQSTVYIIFNRFSILYDIYTTKELNRGKKMYKMMGTARVGCHLKNLKVIINGWPNNVLLLLQKIRSNMCVRRLSLVLCQRPTPIYYKQTSCVPSMFKIRNVTGIRKSKVIKYEYIYDHHEESLLIGYLVTYSLK